MKSANVNLNISRRWLREGRARARVVVPARTVRMGDAARYDGRFEYRTCLVYEVVQG